MGERGGTAQVHRRRIRAGIVGILDQTVADQDVRAVGVDPAAGAPGHRGVAHGIVGAGDNDAPIGRVNPIVDPMNEVAEGACINGATDRYDFSLAAG